MSQPITNLPPRGSQPIGPDDKFAVAWYGWFVKLEKSFNPGGFTGSVTLAKLTPAGVPGLLQFQNGVLTGIVNPT